MHGACFGLADFSFWLHGSGLPPLRQRPHVDRRTTGKVNRRALLSVEGSFRVATGACERPLQGRYVGARSLFPGLWPGLTETALQAEQFLHGVASGSRTTGLLIVHSSPFAHRARLRHVAPAPDLQDDD